MGEMRIKGEERGITLICAYVLNGWSLSRQRNNFEKDENEIDRKNEII